MFDFLFPVSNVIVHILDVIKILKNGTRPWFELQYLGFLIVHDCNRTASMHLFGISTNAMRPWLIFKTLDVIFRN